MVVYAIGADGHAYRRYYEQAWWGAPHWSNWIDDGMAGDFPLRQVGCTTLNPDTIHCAFTDSAGGLWHRRWSSADGWTGFRDPGFPPRLRPA